MRSWTWVICGGLLLAPSAVLAADSQPEPYPECVNRQPSSADRDAAQGAFKAGEGSYNEADYSKAVLYWRDAYRRDCTAHRLLLNLANAYERMGDRVSAVHALKTYLARDPEARANPQLERRIQNLEAQIKADEEKAAKAQPVVPQQPPPSQPEPPPTEEPAQGKSIAPWVVVGAGGVVTIVGAVVYAGGSSKVSDAEDRCPNRECLDPTAAQDGNDGRSQMTVGGVLIGVGLAGVAGGLVWHFVFDKPSGETNAALKAPVVQPTVAPGFAGLSFGGSF